MEDNKKVPKNITVNKRFLELFEEIAKEEGWTFSGWVDIQLRELLKKKKKIK